MKEFIKTSFIMMVFLMLMAVNTYAEVPNMEVKSWCADDMAVGNTTGYNGLEFMLPVGGTADNGITITDQGRMYNADHDYENAIKTNGAVNMGANYVPKGRAMKFTVTQPCDFVAYAYGASRTADVCLQISRAGKIVDTIPLNHAAIDKYATYLDAAGTYYVYSTGGSMAVCEMQVGYVKGDLDFDFDVTWNDVRLIKKKFNYDPSVVRNHKFDVNSDGLYTANDVAILIDMTLADEKARFVNSADWNANDMPMGRYETYEGLEMVPKAGDITNGSVNVISANGTFKEESGEIKKYTKCISLNGKGTNEFGPYPVSRALKFNLSDSRDVVIYMRCDSSVNVQHKARIVDGDGELVKELDVDKTLRRYVVKLDGNETYFLYGVYGGLEVYEINICDMDAPNNVYYTKNLGVTAGQSYELNLVAVNSFYADKTTYKLTYDPNVLSLKSLGGESKITLNKLLPSGITVLSTTSNSVTFSVPDRGLYESGILTNVEFSAKKTGNTSIKLEGLVSYD